MVRGFGKPGVSMLVVGVLGILLGVPGAAHAQGPPIQTDTAIMLGLEGRGFRSFLRVVRKDELLKDGNEIPDSLNRTATAYIYPLIVPYNLRSTLQVGAAIPFVTKNLESIAGSNSHSGLGDITVFVKQLLFQVDRRRETFRGALKVSVKLPTGDENDTIPLGTGSVDYGASAVVTWIKARWGFYGEVIYFHNTSDGDIDYGNRLGYNVALGYRLIPGVYDRYPQPLLNLYLELNGSEIGRTDVDGVVNPNSGGSLLFLSPGIQYVGGRRWLTEASVQLPLVDEPNGTQLGTNWTASVGVRILIF